MEKHVWIQQRQNDVVADPKMQFYICVRRRKKKKKKQPQYNFFLVEHNMCIYDDEGSRWMLRSLPRNFKI